MKMIPDVFEAFLKCPTKSWLRAAGEPPSGNTYAEWVKTQSVSYRAAEAHRLLTEWPQNEIAVSPVAGELKTAKWRLASSVPVQAQMESCTLESELHAVERVPSEGRGKPAQFIPIRFVFTNKLGKDDKLLLAFDAFVLSAVMGREISVGKIIHGDDHATSKVKTEALAGEVRKRIEKLATLLSNQSPPDLVLNRHCVECEFQARCRKIAVERDDLSLLAGMSAKERQKLRSKGIFTVTQLSHTFRPRRRPKRLRDKREKYHHSLKALAIREKKIHIVGSPELKIEGMPVYLDVEGLPDRDFYYLIGLRTGNGDSAVQHSLWADTVEDEGKIWEEFLVILETVEKPVLIHYGGYETSFFKQMGKRYGNPPEGSAAAAAICSAVNLLSVIFVQIYFPTRSNSLKEVAGWLGFKWSCAEPTGVGAIRGRQQWEESKEHTFKEELIRYNREDCEALATVSKAVAQATAFHAPGEPYPLDSIHFVRAESLKNDLANRYHEFTSRIPVFEQMTEAAHWNYQRHQIRLRHQEHGRSGQLERTLSRLPAGKPLFVGLSRRCPRCGSTACNRQRLRTRLCDELLFGRSSLKLRRIRIVFQVCFCRNCQRHFGTLGHRELCRRYGWNLRSFFFYLVIEMNLPQLAVVTLLNRLFGLGADRVSMNTVKKQAAAYYRDTYRMIMERLLKSHVLHVDETKANVQGKSAYVWVLASLEDVAYLYSDTREGGMIQELLAPFKGVLVSDFYAVYDTISCPQQKCLIHLVRDLNDDLLANPFNEELENLARAFGELMKPILETSNRRGLKRHFLSKHRAFVQRFYHNLGRSAFCSEAAIRWRERFEKHKETLFTFLSFDQVPWHNNGAEHAIKAFARLRRTIAGSSTVCGLEDYLVLLSVCQTCKYMGVDFLDFLRSGEKDIHAFAESRRGRRRRSPTSQPKTPPADETVDK